MIICACHLWEIVLNIDEDESFINMSAYKGIPEKVCEMNYMKAV
jgi:hypothetical protein